MAIIINNFQDQQKHYIKIIEKDKLPFISLEFLDTLISHPSGKIGIKRKNCYIINTIATLIFNNPTKESLAISAMLQYCKGKGYSLLQIQFAK